MRLRAIRIRDESGAIADTVDIRTPVGVELEYDVLRPDHTLLPHYVMHNTQGIIVFVGFDQDPMWRGRPRPVGRYRSIGWIPGQSPFGRRDAGWSGYPLAGPEHPALLRA